MKSDYERASGRQPSLAVIEQVAEAKDVDPVDLPPLYRTVDPEALDSLFEGRSDGSVEFQYAGYLVTVLITGSMFTVETDPETSPEQPACT